MKLGVYKIKNKINDKLYIGSSVDINLRFKAHLNSLRNNKHKNIYLQRAWNKYGEENFEFSIIECVENIDSLIEVEQKYLDGFKSYSKENGYNICTKAGNTLGYKHSEETKSFIFMVKKTLCMVKLG